MATLCKTYQTPEAAREAVEQLEAAGIPADDIRLLMPSEHDIRREVMGSFAGEIPPNAHVGNYGNAERFRRQGKGAYMGDPDAQRQGSFADTSPDDDALRAMLAEAAITGRAAEDVVESLHCGRAIVLTEIA
jgi:hypothetical protein